MKKYIGLLMVFVLAALMFACPALAAEGMGYDNLEAAAAATESAAESSGWQQIIGQACVMLLQIAAGIAALISPLLLKKLLGLVGLKSNAEIEALLNTLIKKGINVADQWAVKTAGEPRGQEKMQVAINFVLDQAKAYKLPAVATAKLVDLIEAQLSRNEKVSA